MCFVLRFRKKTNNFVARQFLLDGAEKKKSLVQFFRVEFFFSFPCQITFTSRLFLETLCATGVSASQPSGNLRRRSYTCTDGTLLLRTCALISCTLVMIFFWWPISVTPSLWMSLRTGGGRDERASTSI